jgi:mono/diheme cytochrome c family protein
MAVEKFVYSFLRNPQIGKQTMTHRWRRHVRRAWQVLTAAVLAGAVTITLPEVTAAQQAKSVWDGVYTEQQAASGAITFSASCARCHSSEPNGGEEGKRLAGDHFWQSFRESTVDALLDFVSRNMPNGAPGTLSASAYADVVAFILSRNGLPAGSTESFRMAHWCGSWAVSRARREAAGFSTGQPHPRAPKTPMQGPTMRLVH